jgi:hypothetical protein
MNLTKNDGKGAKKLRAKEVNPDIANRQRRRGDTNRVWSLTCEEWTAEDIRRLYDWIGQFDLDLGHEIFDLQKAYDDLAFEISRSYVEYHPQRGAPRTALSSGDWKALWKEYERTGQVLAHRRHIRQMAAPLLSLASHNDQDLPTGDATIYAFWELCLKDAGRDRRDGSTPDAPSDAELQRRAAIHNQAAFTCSQCRQMKITEPENLSGLLDARGDLVCSACRD